MSSGQTSCARILLRAGARPDQAKADSRETALMFATYGGHAAAVRLLLEAGAAPDHAKHTGDTAVVYVKFRQYFPLLWPF